LVAEPVGAYPCPQEACSSGSGDAARRRPTRAWMGGSAGTGPGRERATGRQKPCAAGAEDWGH
jgi:hypothetical protein